LTRALPTLDLRSADFTGVDQGLDAAMGKTMTMLVHASAQSRAVEPVLPAISVIVALTKFTLHLRNGSRSIAIPPSFASGMTTSSGSH